MGALRENAKHTRLFCFGVRYVKAQGIVVDEWKCRERNRRSMRWWREGEYEAHAPLLLRGQVHEGSGDCRGSMEVSLKKYALMDGERI
jgi:hypothetical protein